MRNTQEVRRRLIALDALRILAIVAVVATHTLMPYRDLFGPHSPVRTLDDFLHWAVPLFVFISGALLWARPWHGGPGAYVAFMKRRVSLIGYPFLAWSVVYAVLLLATDPPPLTELPARLLVGNVWYHLYFIPMLLTFYLLTPLASRLVNRRPELLLLIAYAIRLFLGPELPDATRNLLGDAGWSYTTHLMNHLPHMALGGWFAVRLPRWPKAVRSVWPLLVATGTTLLLAESLGWGDSWPLYLRRTMNPLGMASIIIGLTLMAIAVEPLLDRWRGRAIRLADLAFGVYFVHPLMLFGVTRAVAAVAGPDAWLDPKLAMITFVVVVAASFATSWALGSRKRTAWLVGLKRA